MVDENKGSLELSLSNYSINPSLYWYINNKQSNSLFPNVQRCQLSTNGYDFFSANIFSSC